jgi:hypothetical protein
MPGPVSRAVCRSLLLLSRAYQGAKETHKQLNL